jgi:holo-[acyl-carrier protein] synthase
MIGSGIDLFDVARLARQVSRDGADILDELFTQAERASCERLGVPVRGYAERFAIKEACFKALGTGKIGDMSWRDIDVSVIGPGRFSLALSGATAQWARTVGISSLAAATAVVSGRALAWVVAQGRHTEVADGV